MLVTSHNKNLEVKTGSKWDPGKGFWDQDRGGKCWKSVFHPQRENSVLFRTIQPVTSKFPGTWATKLPWNNLPVLFPVLSERICLLRACSVLMTKLELIETCRNLETQSGPTGVNMGLAHLGPCRQMGVLESRGHSPDLSVACVHLGQVSSPHWASASYSVRGKDLNQMNFTASLCSKITRCYPGNPCHHSVLQYANQLNLVIGQSWREQFNKLW